MLNGNLIDELLNAFQSFAEEHHKENHLPVHLALKAGQVIGKLDRSFNKTNLVRIIDPSMIRRAERLLSDFTTSFRGFSPPREIACNDISPLLDALVAGLTIPAYSKEDILSSTDDDVTFAEILMARIGTRPLLEDVDFRMGEKPAHLPVLIDKELFTDLLTYLLEDLVGIGSDTVRMDIKATETTVIFTLTGNVVTADAETARAMRFLHRFSAWAGGTLARDRDATGATQYTVEVCRAI
jgi:hypothetical protein